ncbi:hypothetical protein C9374_001536 [Naegleria lovaniensis]|uniref:Uncharacterized protein n=1 Tax=Naegleria lovaniensis TaxID=51637 RepID=A0AA88KMR3_NAELO|nr:uncharacterized protein C9374_001536 [Naegleria lovaniensis]KAG2387204.1 hypothetical protein C9374_001536 [Naegleria lovaniensis]
MIRSSTTIRETPSPEVKALIDTDFQGTITMKWETEVSKQALTPICSTIINRILKERVRKFTAISNEEAESLLPLFSISKAGDVINLTMSNIQEVVVNQKMTEKLQTANNKAPKGTGYKLPVHSKH